MKYPEAEELQRLAKIAHIQKERIIEKQVNLLIDFLKEEMKVNACKGKTKMAFGWSKAQLYLNNKGVGPSDIGEVFERILADLLDHTDFYAEYSKLEIRIDWSEDAVDRRKSEKKLLN